METAFGLFALSGFVATALGIVVLGLVLNLLLRDCTVCAVFWLTVLMVVFHLGGVLHIGDTFFHFRNFLIDQWPVVIAGTLGYLCSGVLFLAVWYPYWIRKQVQHMADSGMRLTEAHSLHPKNNKHLIINRGVFWPLWLLVTILDNPLRRVFNYIFFDLLYQWFLKHWDKAVQAAFPDAKTRDPDRG